MTKLGSNVNASFCNFVNLATNGVSAAKRDQIVKKFFFEIMNILDQMIEFTSISLIKKFLIKFSIWSLFAALTPNDNDIPLFI